MPTKSSFYWTCSLFLALFVLSSLPVVQAQSVEQRAKRKVTRRVDRKVDQTIDRGIDDALNSIEGIFKPKPKSQRTRPGEAETETAGEVEVEGTESGGVRVTSQDNDVEVTIEEDTRQTAALPSTFIGYFTMQVSEYKNGKLKKDSPTVLSYHIDTYRFAFVTQDEAKETEMIVIMDRQSRRLTNKIDNKDGRTATIMPMPRLKVGVSNRSVEEGTYTVSETGRTRNILGYDCREYRVETEAEVTLAWIAEDFNPDLQRSLDFIEVKGGSAPHYNNLYRLEGMVLEAHTEVKGKNETRDMVITDLVPGLIKPAVFSLEGYQVTDVSSMFGN